MKAEEPVMRRETFVNKSPDMIIRGGIILTLTEGEEPIADGRVVISDGRIAEVRRPWEADPIGEKAKESMDATDALVMPGLINGHTHGAMTLFRGFCDDLPLSQWLYQKIFPAEAAFLNPQSVYWGTLLACLEMVASGTTTFMDGYFFEDAAAEAVKTAGLRALMAQGVIDFPAPGVHDPKENLRVGKEFIERWTMVLDCVRPGLFCHSPLTCSAETLRRAWEISQEFHLPLQIHVSETAEEVEETLRRRGQRPVHYLESLGILGPGLVMVHGIHLDDEELDRIGERQVRVVHVPESNMKLGAGIAKVPQMLHRGITVGLGTDGCASNNDLDLFQEMDTAAKLSKVFAQDPTVLDARTVLALCTRMGAKVLGMEKEIGTLEKGKRADIVIMDLKAPHLCPLYDPFSALVYSARGSDVRDVMVNGRILMRNREFMTLDPEEILSKVREIGLSIAGQKSRG